MIEKLFDMGEEASDVIFIMEFGILVTLAVSTAAFILGNMS